MISWVNRQSTLSGWFICVHTPSFLFLQRLLIPPSTIYRKGSSSLKLLEVMHTSVPPMERKWSCICLKQCCVQAESLWVCPAWRCVMMRCLEWALNQRGLQSLLLRTVRAAHLQYRHRFITLNSRAKYKSCSTGRNSSLWYLPVWKQTNRQLYL